MAAKTVAIGGTTSSLTSADDIAFDARAKRTHSDITQNAQTGSQLLAILKTTAGGALDCIARLIIFSHAYDRGLILGGNNSGWYADEWTSMTALAAILSSKTGLNNLEDLINAGSVNFCPNSVTKLVGCNTANGQFAETLSGLTRGVVYGSIGSCYPEIKEKPTGVKFETGRFVSQGPGWQKYVAGVKIPDPHLSDPDLTAPGPKSGVNLLRVWS